MIVIGYNGLATAVDELVNQAKGGGPRHSSWIYRGHQIRVMPVDPPPLEDRVKALEDEVFVGRGRP